MQRRRTVRFAVLSILLSHLAAAAGRAQEADTRPTFAAPDRSVSFRYPEGWHVISEGAAIHLAGMGGARYRLERDAVRPFPSGDPTLSSDLRTRADGIASRLLQSPSYAGVQPINLSAGSGAVFRFRGSGASGTENTVEVWFASISGHSVEIASESPGTGRDAPALTALLRSMTFSSPGASSPAGDESRGRDRRNGKDARTAGGKGASQGAASPGGAERATMPSSPPAASTDARPAERYEGHLTGSDLSFGLKLYHGGTAAATWSKAPGSDVRYAGTYAGEDGNYSVKLTPEPGQASGAGPLDLSMRSIGGMVSAQYKSAAAGWRDVASLKLMEVDVGDVKLKGSRAGAARSSQNRGSAANRNRRGNGRRGNSRRMSNGMRRR